MARREGPDTVSFMPLTPIHGALQCAGPTVSNPTSAFLTARADVGVSGGGRFYYEVTLNSSQSLYVGFCTAASTLDPANGGSLGSDESSFSYDGYSGVKQSAGKQERYGERYLSSGTIIGVLLDLDLRRISYSVNGIDQGVCFTNIPKNQLMYPAVSMRRQQQITFNFGQTKFKFADGSVFGFHLVLTAKQKTSISKLFDHYQKIGSELSESQDDRGDSVIRADGVFQFATDAGAKDDSDPLLLVIAWK